MDDSITIPVNIDAAAAKKDLGELESLAKQFGSAMTSALKSAVLDGQKLSIVFRQLALDLSSKALSSALAPLESSLTSGIGGLLSGLLSGVSGFAKGGLIAGGNVQPFAKGGVVAAPSYFPMNAGAGLMGEAGPEAIMPLARGPDGRLGVRGAGGGISTNVSVNIQTRDADSFRKSEGYVSAMLARAVGRGQRNL